MRDCRFLPKPTVLHIWARLLLRIRRITITNSMRSWSGSTEIGSSPIPCRICPPRSPKPSRRYSNSNRMESSDGRVGGPADFLGKGISRFATVKSARGGRYGNPLCLQVDPHRIRETRRIPNVVTIFSRISEMDREERFLSRLSYFLRIQKCC